MSTDTEGASALEFAFVLPVLLLLLFGMIEFGFIFQAELAVTHAAREGARMAAVNEDTWEQALVVDRAYPLQPPKLTVSKTNPTADSVSVTVSYSYDTQILPFLGTIPLQSTATMRKE